MKKILAAILLVSVIILWKEYFEYKFYDYSISQWGVYFFCVPTVYSLIMIFTNVQNLFKTISTISTGVIISILLSRDLVASLLLLKILATLAGSFLLFLILRKINKIETI